MTHSNILRWFQDTVEKRGEAPCLQFKKNKIWHTLSWTQTLEAIERYGRAFQRLHVEFGDRIGVLATTRYEWTLIDMAILSWGGVTTPIYQSSTPEEILYILNDSDAKILIVENPVQLSKVLSIWDQARLLKYVVLIEGESDHPQVLSLERFAAQGQGISFNFASSIRSIQAEHLATLVYTSGTTGVPKGVMLNHGNLLASSISAGHFFQADPEWVSLIFLPLAHILGRVTQFFQLVSGFTHAYAENLDRLIDNFQETKPYFMVGVPRIFEKVYQGMQHNAEQGSAVKKKVFRWAVGVGREYSDCLMAGRSPSLSLKLRYGLAFRLVFSKLHAKLGGRIKYFVSGGAPLSAEIGRFFHGAGITILEGYGLTETTAAFSSNRVDDNIFGTVGAPAPGSEVKFASDGELLVSGPLIAQGYWKKPEATAECFKNGWLHTGDIGELDAQGHLRITDRKKDLIVTSGGKNIAPQKLENILKLNPLISQVMVYGDKQKYLTALVTLNPQEISRRSKQWGLNGQPYPELVKNPRLHEEVKKIIEKENSHLAKFETIKRFAILDQDFTVDGGELTPSMKVKRKVVAERYRDVIDKLYAE